MLPPQFRRSSPRARSVTRGAAVPARGAAAPMLCPPLAPGGARGTSEAGTLSGKGHPAVLKLQNFTSARESGERETPPWAPGSRSPPGTTPRGSGPRPPGHGGQEISPLVSLGKHQTRACPRGGPADQPGWTPLLAARRSGPSAPSPAGPGAGTCPAGACGSETSQEQRRNEQPLGRPSRVGAQDDTQPALGFPSGCAVTGPSGHPGLPWDALLQGPQRAPGFQSPSGLDVDGW